MFQFVKKHKLNIAVFLISLILCLLGSGHYPIYILDEAKNAEAAREMLSNGNFITPYFNNILRTDKPPLHYFFMILSYKIFGVNAFAARFFSGVFGALTMATSYHFVKKNTNKTNALVYILILWSSVFFVQEFHLSVPDPYLIFFISAGLWCFYNFQVSNNKTSLWLFYVCLAFGVLAKGPVAIALPGLICLIFIIATKQFSINGIFKYKPILGLLIILIIALPWYILVHIKTNGAWTQGFFIDHNINRFGSKMEGHGGIFLITWAFVLLGLMPFSFFIINAIKNAYFNRKNTLTLFALIVSSVFIVFFSISGTKLPNYTMPCYPFLAFLISLYLVKTFQNNKKKTGITVVVILITMLSVLLPIAGKLALANEKSLTVVSNVAYWLIPTSVLSVIGLFFYLKNQFNKSFLSIASGWIMLAPILFLVIYPKLTNESPVQASKKIISKNSKIIVYKRFDPAFPINFKRTFNVSNKASEVFHFIENNPDGFIITNDRNDYKILSEHKNLELVLERKAIFENHTTRIFRKKQ
ncbi:glycosyltransferase family 39 protein [Tamlana sp. 62-3]|uniref:Glycosyltransferase family 39 protein n=1 Tax=Neotamlana sargassicola TaxID=2883125 RepID=A0A9X1I572_9FLAO|nr:glycosyltransferase family 39 protein [Tamlana sargassicola]MCB4807492.1 glycosyltransferase family 39 protein [Tamlana sargassicola]